MKKNMLMSQVVFTLLFLTFFLRATPEQKCSVQKRIAAHNEPLVFPPYFKKGVALSFYQNGGDKWGTSNWKQFESKKDLFGRNPIDRNQVVGKSTDFWNKAFEDIALVKELGCTALRFSIEWTGIEPEEGWFNEEAFTFYSMFIDKLLLAGIEPCITLHHFTHPLWFENLGGFEKEHNIDYFTRFAKKVFERFGSRVHMWYTINEPGVQSFTGYVLGLFSPGKFLNFHAAGNVLKNLLNAHVQTYQAIKAMPHGKEANIGIVHQLLKTETCTPWFPTGPLFSALMNFSIANEQIFNFFKTGEFSYNAPGTNKINYINPLAPHSYDFIGINYYSRVVLGAFGPTCYADETMTDMEYAIYPQGIYDAIVEASQLGVPIYITENGIADAKDKNRARFIREYLNAVHAALEDGYDIRGYFYWSLLDNFEWHHGFDMKFGLYEVNLQTQQRSLREGSKIFKDYFTIEKDISAHQDEHKKKKESWIDSLTALFPAMLYS